MKKPTTRWRGLVILVGVLIVAGLLLGACGSSTSTAAAARAPPGRPSRAAPTTSPSVRTRSRSTRSSPTRARACRSSTSVFQGLVQGHGRRQGRHRRRARPRRELGHDRRPDVDLPPQEGRHVRAAGQPRGHGAGLRRLVELGHRPKNASPVSYILAPIEGCARRAATGPTSKKGLTGVKAIDNYTLRSSCGTPSPSSSTRSCTRCRPCCRSTTSRRSATRPSLRSRWAPGPTWSPSGQHKQNIELVKNPSYWDKAERRLRRRHPHADHRLHTRPRGSSSRRAPSTTRTCRRARRAPRRTCPRSSPASGPPRAGRTSRHDYIGFNMTDKVVGGTQGLELRKALYMADRRGEPHQHRATRVGRAGHRHRARRASPAGCRT